MNAQLLHNKVLVLNSQWMPIDVTTVFEAVCKAFIGNAVFVDPETYATYDFESWIFEWTDAIDMAHINERDFFRCVEYGVKLPEIIIATKYDGQGTSSGPHQPKFSRRNVFLRDKNTCQYCSKKCKTEDMNLDHVIPKSRGGGMVWNNIVAACIKCNDRKAARTPREASMHLIREPFRPTAKDIQRPAAARLKRKIGKEAPKTWENFLGKLYWNMELRDD